MNKLLILLTFIILFTAGWIGWQRISSQADQQSLKEIQQELTIEEQEIGELEGELLIQAQKLTDIEGNLAIIQDEIEGIEAAHPDGIPPDLYEAYGEQVNRFNALVTTYNETLADYDAIFEDYAGRVGRYNDLVGVARELANAIGSPWSIEQLVQIVGE